MGQVGDLGALIGEDGPVHGGQLGQALQGVLGHVRVLTNLPVYLQDERRIVCLRFCFFRDVKEKSYQVKVKTSTASVSMTQQVLWISEHCLK